jgi:hypothetical protein
MIKNKIQLFNISQVATMLGLIDKKNKENGLRISEIRNVADYGRKEIALAEIEMQISKTLKNMESNLALR